MTAHAPLTTIYVDTPGPLAEAVAAINRAPVVGFDTEFVGETTYEPKLCLLQVATAEGVWVIDPLAPRLDLTAFWQALTAPGREMVALAARQELLFCLRNAGRLPEKVLDPQIAAGLVGYGYPLSHTNLVLKVLDIRVPAGETFTDWRKRPLTPAQLEYAAADVVHLLVLRDQLLSMARTLHREEWVWGECERQRLRVAASDREERWGRVPGAASLNPRRLAALRALWRWRDATARTTDQPPRRVLSDDLLIEVAKRSPKTTQDLFALRGFDRSSLRKAGPELVDAVLSALALPESELPKPRRRDDPSQVTVLGQILAVVSNNLAAQHAVDPALLATSGDLQEFVRWHLGISEEGRPPILEGWRGEILGQPLLDLLEGRSRIRVTDAQSATPLSIESA